MWTIFLANSAGAKAWFQREWDQSPAGPAKGLETQMVAKLRKNQAMDQPHHGHAVAALVEPKSADNPDMLAVGSPLPKAIGLCADLYHDVRELRLLMEKEVAVIQARESEIREHIISNLSKSDDTGAAGKRYRAQIINKEVPKLADWNKFCDYVYEHNRFDLIQKRLGEKAVADLWEAGETIDGVEKMHVPTVSITKI
jgi:hypothetical protein